MIYAEFNETEFVGVIKNMIRVFIDNCSSIDDFTKSNIVKELGNNWFDPRFNVERFQSDAISIIKADIEKYVKEDIELWDRVVISSASWCNDPSDLANKVLDERMKRYGTSTIKVISINEKKTK